MTPGAVNRWIEGYWKRKKNDWERAEWQSWQIGAYVMCAIGASFSKKVKYPDNPLKREGPVDISKMTEDEIAKEHEKVLENLDLLAKMALGVKGE